MKLEKAIAIAGILLALGAVVFVASQQKDSLGGVIMNSYTNSVANVATASTEVLAANTARQYVRCDNKSTVGQRLDITFGTVASKNYGFPLYASQSFTITPNELGEIYIGAVYATAISEVASRTGGGRINCVTGTY